MANWQVISLDTVTPQLRAPGTGDGYSFNSGSTQLGVWTTTGLGVGTASPAGKLTVSNAGAAGIEFYPTGGVGGGPYYGAYNRSTSAYISFTNYASTHTWFVSTAGNVRAMDLDSSGNLGIGTASPGYRLHVERASYGITGYFYSNDGTRNPRLVVYGSSSGTTLQHTYSTGADSLMFAVGGSIGSGVEVARFDSSGNLGLGVTPTTGWRSGARAFQSGANKYVSLWEQSNGSANLGFAVYESGTNTFAYTTTGDAPTLYSQLSGAHKWYTAPSGTAGNTISFTQAMTLDSSGRLLVGTTTNNAGEALQVDANGVGASIYTAIFRNTSTSTSVYNAVRFNQGASGSAVGYIGTGGSAVSNSAFANNFVVGTQSNSALVFNTNDTERARIPAAGGVVVGTAALATNATDGFLYIPGCAGTPTGTPTAYTGRVPLVVDTTNNKLYFYSGGAWRDAGP